MRQLSAAVVVLVLVLVPAIALAEDPPAPESPDPSFILPLSALREAEDAAPAVEAELTDPELAAQLPHRNLNRGQAFELLEGVFAPLLESPAGGFDSLDVEKFLSDHAAIVNGSALKSAVTIGAPEATESEARPVLLESTLPLRTEGPFGQQEAVDLSLVRNGQDLESVTPLEPVEIAGALGEGVALPNSGVEIELVGAPSERSPSIVEESVAVYPNVATDTDLAVAPTPTGVETFTALRSPDAPRIQTFRLALPAGASLVAADRGAEVVDGAETLLKVHPASAVDASGADVPVDMAVSGSTLTLTVFPGPDTTWPILVDPLYEGFAWQNGATQGYAGWVPWTNNGTIIPGFGANWGPGYTGAYIEAQAGYYGIGAQAMWTHSVPRLAEEEALGRYPTSFISRFTLQGISLITSPGLASPFLFGGVFSPSTQKWSGKPGSETVWSYPGNAGWLTNATITFENGTPGNRDQLAHKAYGMSLAVSEPGWLAAPRASYLAAASVEILDETRPTVANATVPSGWANQTALGPITVDAVDTGLGVKNVVFGVPGQGEITVGNPCGGQTQDPCPYHQNISLSTGAYSPAAMPQGNSYVSIRAHDVLWNATSEQGLAKALIRVDHTKPALTLSGTATEQATLGTTLPQYMLKYSASDGSEGSPQSGVVSTEVKLDGQPVQTKYAPGCATKNCTIVKEWTLNAANYSAGQHVLEVIATDGVGLVTSKTQTISLAPDTTAPILNPTGNVYTAPEGWVEQKSYSFLADASDANGYGIAELRLKVDGSTVQVKTPGCPQGKCGATLIGNLNTALYGGGAHPAELIAKDGAGNTTKKEWTINVDPQGVIGAVEAADTLEAVEETEPEAELVATTAEVLELGIREAGDDPSFQEVGDSIESEGTRTETTVDTDTGAVVIEGADGPLEVEPAEGAPLGEPVIAGDAATVTPAAVGVDTIVRPVFNGSLFFTAIREPTASEVFTWRVNLKPWQTLRSIDEGHAEVIYEDETRAFLISAEPAHDATGKEVPTHIEVDGSEIVLTVEHQGGNFAYPVLAGQAYETGYSTVVVIVPEVEEVDERPAPPGVTSSLSAAEAKRLVKVRWGGVTVSAPSPDGGGASISKIRTFMVRPFRRCSEGGLECDIWWIEIKNPSFERGSNWVRWEPDTQIHCHWWSSSLLWPELEATGGYGCGFTDVKKAYKGQEEVLTVYGRFIIRAYGGDQEYENPIALNDWVFPNGYVTYYVKKWNPLINPL